MNSQSRLFAERLTFSLFTLTLLSAWLVTSVSATAQAMGDEAMMPVADEAIELDETPVVGWLVLDQPLRNGPLPFAWSTEDDDPSLEAVLGQMQTVADGDQYLGLVIKFDLPPLSFSQAIAIADGIKAIREQGKTVMTIAQQYDTIDYMIASQADLVLLQHKGELNLTGLGMEEMYLAGMFDKIGIEADFVQVGEFKGADEAMTRTGPSDAWNENFDSLLDDMYDQIISRIADGRQMTKEQVESIMADSWTLEDSDLLRRRAVDRLVDPDLIELTEIEFGDDFVWDTAMGMRSAVRNVQSPFAFFNQFFAPQTAQRRSRPAIAKIYALGPIHSGDSSFDDGLFGDSSIGSRTLIDLMRDAADDDEVKGAVIYIDSPGGSAIASEMIWQAVRDLRETKPVYVVVGGMAASGGYYIACAADQIYVGEPSILGSIGVVGGKLAMGGLYDWAGINVYTRTRGPNGGLFNSVDPFTQDERQMIRKSMEKIYDQFTDRVARGRGQRITDIDKIARGRLFTGRQTLSNGMADKLGDSDTAIADMADALGLQEDSYDVIEWPEPQSIEAIFEDFLGAQFNRSPEVKAKFTLLEQALGKEVWSNVRRHLGGLMLLRQEPVLTLMPNAVIIR